MTMNPFMTEPNPAAVSPAPYPTELVRAVTLKNGAHVRIRPIRPDDEPRLIELYGRLSRYTAYQRFFTVMRRLPPDWAHFFANVDYRKRLALVAERDTAAGVQLIGVGRYEPAEEPDTAEVAFVVEDGWQGFGLGAILLLDVVRAAEARGIRRFRAYCLADNHRMLRLLAELTDVRERKTEEGVTAVLFGPRREATSA
jgi:RimJ/RimL family protein N-acetyltransferase